MKTIKWTAGFAGSLLLWCGLGQAFEPAREAISTRILLQDSRSSALYEVSDRRTFYDGQRFRLAVQSRRSGYLYILCETSRGETKLLHPSELSMNNSIEAGETATFPGRGWFRFDNDPGTEKVFVVMAGGPIAELDRAGEDGGDITPEMLHRYSRLGAGDASSDTRGIEVVKPAFSVVKKIVLRHDSADGF